MPCVEFHQDEFTVSDDPARLQVPVIHAFLSERSYWAQGRPIEVVEKAIANSLNFGMYARLEDGSEQQVGFARVVTDRATFAWLCDVFVLETHRGKGLGKFLIRSVTHHPDLCNLRRMVLSTRDAHGLYRSYGEFIPLDSSDHWMVRLKVNT